MVVRGGCGCSAALLLLKPCCWCSPRALRAHRAGCPRTEPGGRRGLKRHQDSLITLRSKVTKGCRWEQGLESCFPQPGG